MLPCPNSDLGLKAAEELAEASEGAAAADGKPERADKAKTQVFRDDKQLKVIQCTDDFGLRFVMQEDKVTGEWSVLRKRDDGSMHSTTWVEGKKSELDPTCTEYTIKVTKPGGPKAILKEYLDDNGNAVWQSIEETPVEGGVGAGEKVVTLYAGTIVTKLKHESSVIYFSGVEAMDVQTNGDPLSLAQFTVEQMPDGSKWERRVRVRTDGTRECESLVNLGKDDHFISGLSVDYDGKGAMSAYSRLTEEETASVRSEAFPPPGNRSLRIGGSLSRKSPDKSSESIAGSSSAASGSM